MRLFGPSLVLAFLLCGCAPAAHDLPPAPRVPASAPAYRVQVGDLLGIRLYMAPELSEDVAVRPDGRITTILAQSVPAAGRTPEEIAADLHRIYAGELKNPELTVGVKTASPARIFVAGEVIYPGEIDYSGPPLTLLQAVSKAGGLRTTGDAGHVFILRHGSGDTAIVLSTNFNKAIQGRDSAADVTLAPFDVVVVPKTGISKIYVWFNQHFQQFVPVSWGFSYNVNPVVNNTRP
jgi:protein involved in polysaccharide export with SLBB domain